MNLERSKRVASAAIISLVLVAAVILIAVDQDMFGSDGIEDGEVEWAPSWAIGIGDSFNYSLMVSSFEFNPGSVPSGEVQYLEFNNTILTVEITALPALPSSINTTLFVNQILKAVKTEMQYPNGSAVDEQLSFLLNPIFSMAFLPTGAWNEIDALLPETIEIVTYYYTGAGYFSRLHGEHMTIGYFHWHIDSGGEKGANVSLSSGIPFLVYIYWNSLSDSTPGFLITAKLRVD